MREYYFEVRVGRPAPTDYGRRLGEVFFALHRAIRGEGSGETGLSFPGWKGGASREEVSLGERIYVVSKNMETLASVLGVLRRDTVAVEHGEIAIVPAGAARAIFARSRKHQRYHHFARHGDAPGRQTAKAKLKELSVMPSVSMRSSSSGQRFLVLIDKRSIEESTEICAFNSYGLSSGLTVPVF